MAHSVCLIGGNGFLGSYIVDELLEHGYDLTVYGRSPERFRPASPAVRYVTGDFAVSENLDTALSKVDTVVHSLTSMTVASSNTDMIGDVQTNLIGAIHFLHKCIEHRIRRVVFLSSGGAVYGPTKTYPTPETVLPQPLSSYGAVKLAIENYLAIFATQHGLEQVSLRVSNPYGPRQDPRGNQGAISIFAGKAISGGTITIFGDGSTVRDYIHASDCSKAILKAIESEHHGYVANVGSGEGTSLNRIVEILAKNISAPLKVERTGARSSDVDKSVLDISRFSSLTGWVPTVDLEDGIRDVLSWLEETKGNI